ncbi:DUF6503 family protein [Maribacter sp. 2-571]|uniref:DUF6503 family protein n=1 Tax=Maribacter sp. 2-571 TaxID=3417569 RepID=UPI003D33FB30
MHRIALLPMLAMLFLVSSCKTDPNKEQSETAPEDRAKIETSKPRLSEEAQLLHDVVAAHGGERYKNAFYQFTFRNRNYTFKNGPEGYTYTAKDTKDGIEIYDTLKNGVLTRTVNGSLTSFSDKDVAKYSEALNSVIYFATLPDKLQDKAVQKSFEGSTRIKGIPYQILGVRFTEEDGGTDFDDIFHYWINEKTKTIDYLAYSYNTNGGGVRFRSAYHPRTVNGIRFQDYVNYKAPIGTPLKKLPALFEEGNLEVLSKIVTENVISLNGD